MINTITFSSTAGKDAGTQVKVDRIEADLKILKLQVYLSIIENFNFNSKIFFFFFLIALIIIH
jgi:hypothetical protein